jgi:hypothetical protein
MRVSVFVVFVFLQHFDIKDFFKKNEASFDIFTNLTHFCHTSDSPKMKIVLPPWVAQ